MPVSDNLHNLKTQLNVLPLFPSDLSNIIYKEKGISYLKKFNVNLTSNFDNSTKSLNKALKRFEDIIKFYKSPQATMEPWDGAGAQVPLFNGFKSVPSKTAYEAKEFMRVQRLLENVTHNFEKESYFKAAFGKTSFPKAARDSATTREFFTSLFRTAESIMHPRYRYKDDQEPLQEPYFGFPMVNIFNKVMTGINMAVGFSPLLFVGLVIPVVSFNPEFSQLPDTITLRLMNADSPRGLVFKLKLTLPEKPTTETLNVEFLNLFAEDSVLSGSSTNNKYVNESAPTYRFVSHLEETGAAQAKAPVSFPYFDHIKQIQFVPNPGLNIPTLAVPLQPFKLKFVDGELINPVQYFWTEDEDVYKNTWVKPTDWKKNDRVNYLSTFTVVKIEKDPINELVYNVLYILPKKRFLGVGGYWLGDQPSPEKQTGAAANAQLWGESPNVLSTLMPEDSSQRLTINNPTIRTRLGFLEEQRVDSYLSVAKDPPEGIPNAFFLNRGLDFRAFYKYEYPGSTLLNTCSNTDAGKKGVSYPFTDTSGSSERFYIRISPSTAGQPEKKYTYNMEDKLDPSLPGRYNEVIIPVHFARPLPPPDQTKAVLTGVPHPDINSEDFVSDIKTENDGRRFDMYYIKCWSEGEKYRSS